MDEGRAKLKAEALARANTLNASAAWGSDWDGHLLTSLVRYVEALEAQLADARGEPDRIVAWLRKLGPWEHISPADLADAIAARAYVKENDGGE